MSATNVLPDKKIFELISRELGISEAFVEKDWHVTQVICALSKINYPGFKLVFTGGTALSKAHKLIRRFSEDIDFVIVTSETIQNRKARSILKRTILKALQHVGYHIEENQVKARNENQFFTIDVGYDTSFSRLHSLRPHIQIEMAVKTTQLPSVKLPVSSFVAELTKKPPEVESMSCLDAVENAADKLSALAWRISDRVRGDPEDDPTIVRHIYDLAMLKNIALAHVKFKSLVTFCMEQDGNRPKNNLQFYGFSMQDKFEKMLSVFESDNKYPGEYDQFVKGVLYSSENSTPDFEKAVESIRLLVKRVMDC